MVSRIRAVLLSWIGFSLFVTVSAAAPDETTIQELAPGVHFRKAQTSPKFTGCNQGWVIFKDYVLVIDANFPGQVKEVVESIRKTTDKPIRFVFDTHYHGDHADGNVKYIELGATVLAHERSQPLFQTKGQTAFANAATSKDRAAEYGDLKYGIPSMYFSHKLIFDDGEQRVELIFLGHAHTAGDAVAWLPKHGILFTGDACVNGAFNYTGDSNTESWIAVLGAMQELGVKKVAPGHGELSDAELLAKQQRYFLELRTELRKAIDSGRTLEQIKQEIDIPFYREWAGVDVKTRGENIEHVYRELTAALQPLQKSTSFLKWQRLPGEYAYASIQAWDSVGECDADKRFSQLADLYLKSDSGIRGQIRNYFSNRDHELNSMWLYVRRMGTRIGSPKDVEWVRRALAIAAIEGGRADYRDTIASLVLLRHGAERTGLYVDPLFRQIQEPEFLSPENKPMFESARTLSADEIAKTVASFGPPAWKTN
jgi:cyclase